MQKILEPESHILKLTPAQQFKIGKKADEIGASATICYYTKRYTHLPLMEPTVRRLKNLYIQELKERSLTASGSDFKEVYHIKNWQSFEYWRKDRQSSASIRTLNT